MADRPSTDAEWARDVERRLQSLERARTIRIGQWTLVEDETGSLWVFGDDGSRTMLSGSNTR